jgi:hypothetical protein
MHFTSWTPEQQSCVLEGRLLFGFSLTYALEQ